MKHCPPDGVCGGVGTIGDRPCNLCSVLRYWAPYKDYMSPFGAFPGELYYVTCPFCNPDKPECIRGAYIKGSICAHCGMTLQLRRLSEDENFRESVLTLINKKGGNVDEKQRKDLLKALQERLARLYSSARGDKGAELANAQTELNMLSDDYDKVVDLQHTRIETLEGHVVQLERDLNEAKSGTKFAKLEKDLSHAKERYASAIKDNMSLSASAQERINEQGKKIEVQERAIHALKDRLETNRKDRNFAVEELDRVNALLADTRSARDNVLNEFIAYKKEISMKPPVTDIADDFRANNPTPGPAQGPTTLTERLRASPTVQVLQVDATDAAWRMAGSQFVKLSREPLVAVLSRHLGPGDDALRGRIAAFLDTELGVSILSGVLSAGLSAMPINDPTTQRLSRELRVRAMAGTGDVVADLLMGPLRQVAVMYLQGQSQQSVEPAGLPGGKTAIEAAAGERQEVR